MPCLETTQAQLVRQQAPPEGRDDPLSELEIAKRTLTFYPVTLELSKLTSPDKETHDTMLCSALHFFLSNNRAMPSPDIPSTQGCDISPHPDSDRIRVTFPTVEEVKTIFRYVRNLSPGQKVSLHVPPSLANSYSDLKNRAYNLRHGETPKKTVIRYCGDSLALFAKQPGESKWVHVITGPTGSELEPVQKN